MGTMKEEMAKVGFTLSKEEEAKVKSSLNSLRKKKKRQAICKMCGANIKFTQAGSKTIPHDMDDRAHWETCPYNIFSQKKHSLTIMRKLAVLFIIKSGINLEKEAGLTDYESLIVQAVLEKAFRETEDSVEKGETPGEVLEAPTDEDVEESLKEIDTEGSSPEVFLNTQGAADPIGDPDEDLAPTEEEVNQAPQLL